MLAADCLDCARMPRLISVTAVLALVSFGACGGDDEEPATGASGTTGLQDVSSASGLSANEFIDASIPDQLSEVEDAVAADPGCADVQVKPGGDFQVGVSIDAAQAPPDTPLSEIVAARCAGG